MGSLAFGPILVLLLTISTATDFPGDALGLLDPAESLALLGQETDVDSLRALIAGKAADGAGTGVSAKDVERAIENLASKSSSTRQKAQATLLGAGASIRARLEQVVKKDKRRAAEAKKILDGLSGKQAERDHEVELLQVLGIRYAASSGKKALLPAVQTAQSSKAKFVQLSAEAAVRTLAGDNAETPVEADASTESFTNALAALPQTTRLLLTGRLPLARVGSSSGTTLVALMAEIADSVPAEARGEFDSGIEEAKTSILDFVKTYGNMRPERFSVVNVGAIQKSGAGIGILVHGLYKPEILSQGLEKNSGLWARSDKAGYQLYTSPFVRLVFLDDNTVLVLPQQASVNFPLEGYLENLQANSQDLLKNERFGRFLSTLNSPSRLRGLVVTDEVLLRDAYQEITGKVEAELESAIKGMQEIELTVHEIEGKKSRMRCEAAFEKKAHAATMSEFLKAQIQEAISGLEQFRNMMSIPIIGKVIELLEATKVVAQGEKGILRLDIDGAPLGDWVKLMIHQQP